VQWERHFDWPTPHSMSTRRDQRSCSAPDPARGLSAGADRDVSVREQSKLLGCVSPHNQRMIFTSRLQPGCSKGVATPERYRWPSGIQRNLSISPNMLWSAVNAVSQVDAGRQPG
jgi:hypothetical protein